ncbi:1882_t:CDS:2 [Gigaspora margarita]|uniref:1882_t:CDS:1 n=1 Tax=Gigaspora margarita TaxID=4874 RepID=A0ABN7UEJ3_GIGMA|nr:1882_t:CDS:2 [Gigaspora margarita]
MHTKKSASFIPLALGLILIGFILSTSATPVPGRRFFGDHLSKRTPWEGCGDDGGCGGGYGGGYGGLGGYGGFGGFGGGFGFPRFIDNDRLNIFHKHKFIKDKDIDSINRDRFREFI